MVETSFTYEIFQGYAVRYGFLCFIRVSVILECKITLSVLLLVAVEWPMEFSEI
jgi:hypothetical protein